MEPDAISMLNDTEGEKILDEALKDGLGEGPLTLGIFCTDCEAKFELNPEGAMMAIILNTRFVEYLKWVQSTPCSACGRRKADKFIKKED